MTTRLPLLPDCEQIAAYRVMLEHLFEEIPSTTGFQEMARENALREIKRGLITIARAYAQIGGIPVERIHANEALIF